MPNLANPLPKLYNIQALRGIAALLVVLSHLQSNERIYSQDIVLSPVFRMGMSGVDLFFVISGFIMVYVTHHWSDKGRFKRIPEFLYARATRIYPLYWVLTAFMIFVYFMKPELIWPNKLPVINFKTTLSLLPNMIHGPLLSVGWTLVFEMGFYIVFTFILFFKRKYLLPLLLLWAAFIGLADIIGVRAFAAKISPSMPIPGIPHFASMITHPFSWEFIGGALAAYFFIRVKIQKIFAYSVLIIGILAGLLMAFSFETFPTNLDVYPKRASRVYVFGTVSILIIYGSAALESVGKVFPKFLQLLGDWSYSLYLSHLIVIKLIMKLLWEPNLATGPVDNIAVLILCFVASIVVGGLCYRFIEKPFVTLSKRVRKRIFYRKKNDNREI